MAPPDSDPLPTSHCRQAVGNLAPSEVTAATTVMPTVTPQVDSAPTLLNDGLDEGIPSTPAVTQACTSNTMLPVAAL